MSKKAMKTQLNKLRVVASMKKRQEAKGANRTSGALEDHYAHNDTRLRNRGHDNYEIQN